MSSRRDFFYLQQVTEAELDAAFNALEQADRDLVVDLALVGIASGLVAAQVGAGNLTVDVSAGKAYDQTGQRIRVPSTQNVNCAVDKDGVSTDVAVGGNSKILGIYVKFDRALSDPRVDGNSNSVYFVRDESFTFKVIQGSEAVSPSPPALQSDMLLIADVTRSFGVTTIVTANISTSRREDMFVVAGSPLSIRRGVVEDAISDVVARYNNHISGAADPHVATSVNYAGGSTWLDSTTNPAATVEAQLDKVITDLIGQGATTSGAHKLGCAARTNWLGGRTNAATTIFAAIDKIITDLAATTSSDDGSERIGAQATTGYSAGSIRSQLDEVLSGTQTFTGAKTFDNITASGSNRYKLATRSITRTCRGAAWSDPNNADRFDPQGAGKWKQATANACQLQQTIIAPDGATLTAVEVWIDPDGTGALHAGLPANMPKFTVDRLNVTTGSGTTVVSDTTDASATVAAYEAVHSISATGLSHNFDFVSQHYQLMFTGEHGANALANLVYLGCKLTFTTTSMDDAHS